MDEIGNCSHYSVEVAYETNAWKESIFKETHG